MMNSLIRYLLCIGHGAGGRKGGSCGILHLLAVGLCSYLSITAQRYQRPPIPAGLRMMEEVVDWCVT